MLLNALSSRRDPTRSAIDGVPHETERTALLFASCCIADACAVLGAKHAVAATACVLLQRFFRVSSLKHFDVSVRSWIVSIAALTLLTDWREREQDMAMGAVFLASKLQEAPLRMRDIVNTFDYLLRRGGGDYDALDYFAQAFYDAKDRLVVAEMHLLKRVGFHTTCDLPFGYLVNHLRVLDLHERDDVVRRAWAFVNDMLKTPLPALEPPSLLSITAIYLATRQLGVALPLRPAPWWTLFDATQAQIATCARDVLAIYDNDRQQHTSSLWDRYRDGSLLVDKRAIRLALSEPA